MQFYSTNNFVPKEILLQMKYQNLNIIESYLSNKKGSKVQIKVPKRGDKSELMEMARINAEAALDQMKYRFDNERKKTIGALEELQCILELEKLPHRIEAFDISNIMGTDPVGSMVVFEGGKPKNKDYRRFKIKTINQANDYGSLEEALNRRFKRGPKEIEAIDSEKPGRRGQLGLDGARGEGHALEKLGGAGGGNRHEAVGTFHRADAGRHRSAGDALDAQQVQPDGRRRRCRRCCRGRRPRGNGPFRAACREPPLPPRPVGGRCAGPARAADR